MTRLASALAVAAALIVVGALPSGASGPSWTVTALSMASGYSGELESISCPTPTGCVAVGWTFGTRGAAAASVEQAGSWSPFVAVTAGAVAEQGALYSVSCWASGQCVAVGSKTSGPRGRRLIAYELDGSTWTALSPPPLPGTDPYSGGVSVSCVAPGTCRVMGLVSTSPRGATVRAYVPTFAAGSWSTRSFLVPPNTLRLGPITCTSTTTCAALLDTGSVVRGNPVILRSYVNWMGASGWRWTMPKGWDHFSAAGLDCSTITACVAVGTLGSGRSVVSRQALGWGTFDVVPGGDGASAAVCPTSTCVVPVSPPPCPVTCGHGPDPSGGVMTLKGQTWSPTTMIAPPPLLDTLPGAVSCDATQCAVAGFGEIWVPGGGDAFYFAPFVATLGLPG